MRMSTCESRRHYLKYYKITEHTNLSFILEWQRQFQMVSHKNYEPNDNEDFIKKFNLQVNYVIH